MIQQQARQEIQAAQQYNSQLSHYQRLYSDEKYQPIMADEKMKGEYLRMIDPHNGGNWEPEAALEHLRLKYGYEKLQSERVQSEKAAATAKAQKELSKGRARVERDAPPRGGKPFDPVAETMKWAKENGVAKGSNRFIQKLAEFEQQT